MNNQLRQSLVIFSLVGVVVVNALANILPIAGKTTGELSDLYPILFVPAGYVFSIWGVIYLALIAYVIFQAQGSQRNNPRLKAIAPAFMVNALANIGWILAWHYEILWLSLLLMLVILSTLMLIYLRLDIGKARVSISETLTTRFAFSIYLGWITVATVANFSVVLFNAGYTDLGFGASVWATSLLVVATVIGLTMLFRFKDYVFAMVLVWAFAGIFVKHSDVAVFANTAVATAVILVLVSLYFLLNRNNYARVARTS